jgi:uncharacterized OsmC-like protein
MEHIAEAVSRAQAYLRGHPQEARYTDSAATATIAADLRCSVSGPDGATLQTDMPASVGGSGSAPSPGWFLRAASASCVATLMVMRAAAHGNALSGLSVTVDSESDDRGILGVDEAIPAGPFSTRIKVSALGADQIELRGIAEWAIAHCPVTDAIRRAVPVELQIATT